MSKNQSEVSVPANKKASVKWHVLIGGFISYALDAMDFMLLALALPAIIKEWNMPLDQAGLLGTATLIGVGLSSLILGWFSDHYGRRKALLVSVSFFGLFTGAIALAQNWEQLMILRFLAGLGLGGVFGVVSAFINETWPKTQKGRATSFVLSAWPIGYGLAAFLSAIILPTYGWRPLFATGLAAFLGVIYIYFFIPESEAWKEYKATKALDKKSSSLSLKELFSDKLARITIWGTLVCFCSLTAYWGINTWLPTYLLKERGLDAARMGMFLVMINIGMFIGYQVFGYIADKIGKRKALVISFIGSATMIPIYIVIKDVTLLFWFGPFLFFFASFVGIFGSYFTDLYPIHLRSMGSNFCFGIGRGLSAFAPFVLGQIAVNYSLGTGFGVCAITFIIAAVLMLFLPETKQEEQALTDLSSTQANTAN